MTANFIECALVKQRHQLSEEIKSHEGRIEAMTRDLNLEEAQLDWRKRRLQELDAFLTQHFGEVKEFPSEGAPLETVDPYPFLLHHR